MSDTEWLNIYTRMCLHLHAKAIFLRFPRVDAVRWPLDELKVYRFYADTFSLNRMNFEKVRWIENDLKSITDDIIRLSLASPKYSAQPYRCRFMCLYAVLLYHHEPISHCICFCFPFLSLSPSASSRLSPFERLFFIATLCEASKEPFYKWQYVVSRSIRVLALRDP